MSYTKPPLTFEQQADHLIARGMRGDRDLMITRLKAVNYYRLSGYWYPFRKPDPTNPKLRIDEFHSGASFDTVWNRYVFDRRLRLLVMDAIERIEVAVRSQLAYHHSHEHGAFAYATDPASMPKLNSRALADFTERLEEEVRRSKEMFVKHFRAKYPSDRFLPVWMVTEVMTFGSVLSFFSGATHRVKQRVATTFNMPDKVFNTWLLSLNAVRNICAHHGRLWNRVLGVKPMIPLIGQYPDWHRPGTVDNSRVYAVLTICKHCLNCIAPQSRWPDRLRGLFAEYPLMPIREMGFPVNWETCPIWK